MAKSKYIGVERQGETIDTKNENNRGTLPRYDLECEETNGDEPDDMAHDGSTLLECRKHHIASPTSDEYRAHRS